jgi:hypothetical protein
MNSSLDRWNTFRSLVGSTLFAALTLTLGTTLMVAQEGQPVSKTTAPKNSSRRAGCRARNASVRWDRSSPGYGIFSHILAWEKIGSPSIHSLIQLS